MLFKDYIRQMDDEELAQFFLYLDDFDFCDFCDIADYDVPCSDEYCIKAVQTCLNKDIEDQEFDDFF
ncbi:MAG: hypothetical protein HDQ98_14505, partial [Lachnospiraceae bacterium]|nr:hypothetical protein [Lachnospiraceae bacterium]